MGKLSNYIFLIATSVFLGCTPYYLVSGGSKAETNNRYFTSLQQSKIDVVECFDSTSYIKVYLVPYLDESTTLEGDFYIQYFDGESHFKHIKASEPSLLLKLKNDTEFLLIYYDLMNTRIERSIFNLKTNNCYTISFYMKSSMFPEGNTSKHFTE